MKRSLFVLFFYAGFSCLQASGIDSSNLELGVLKDKPVRAVESSNSISRPFSINNFSTDESLKPVSFSPRTTSVAQSPLMNENFNRVRSNSNLTINLDEIERIATPIHKAIEKGDFDKFQSLIFDQADKGLFEQAHVHRSIQAQVFSSISQKVLTKPSSSKNDTFRAVLVELYQVNSRQQKDIDKLQAVYKKRFEVGASFKELQAIQRKIKMLQAPR
jgi:hypothetical protein